MPGRRTSRLGKEYYQKLSAEERTFFVGFLDGTNKKNVERKASGEQLKRHAVTVVPFGIVPSAAAAAAADNFRCSATKQALEIAKTIDANLAVFGIEGTPAAGSVSNPNFFPALAVITLIDPNNPIASTSNRSRYSNRPIDLKRTRSGSIPFGRSQTAATTTDYQVTVSGITAEIAGKSLTGARVASTSFQPEILRPTAASLPAGGTVNAAIPAF